MRHKTLGKILGQPERLHQTAQFVGVCIGQKAAGELERVENFRAFPLAKLALQNPNVHMCVVGNQHVSGQRINHVGFDNVENGGVGNGIVIDAVNLSAKWVIGVSGRTSQLTG